MNDATTQGIRELVESTADPAYSVDERGRISGWNEPAAKLLGYPRDEILGQPCHEILRGRDVFGNPYCEPDCPLLLMARRRQPMRHFQMDVHTREGTALPVLCFALVVPGATAGTFSLVHLLRPLDRPLELRSTREASERPRLTQRERQVLRLLAAGSTTREMAETLTVSTSTVRKHVQSLLRKLEVGSRLAAVLAAFERQLL